jgi:hypothetical protein
VGAGAHGEKALIDLCLLWGALIMARQEKPKAQVTLASVHAGDNSEQKLTAFEVEQLEAEAIIYLPAIMKRWLPDGRLSGHRWNAQHPKSSTHVISVDLHDGSWRDFLDGKSGRTVTSLISHLTNLPAEQAILQLKSIIGARHAA